MTTAEQRAWERTRTEHQYELARGDIGSRTRELGATSLEFAEKQFGSTPKESDAWRRAESRGAESLALKSGQTQDVRGGKASPRGDAARRARIHASPTSENTSTWQMT